MTNEQIYKFQQDYRISKKLRIVSQHDSSSAIVQELLNTIQQYDYECDTNSHEVNDIPYCIESEVELFLEVLSDLADYTKHIREDEFDEVSEDIRYLDPFFERETEYDEYDDEEEEDEDELVAA